LRRKKGVDTHCSPAKDDKIPNLHNLTTVDKKEELDVTTCPEPNIKFSYNFKTKIFLQKY